MDSPLVESVAAFFVNESCRHTLLHDLNFLEVDCLRQALSKVLGYLIVLGSITVKFPQISKILSAGSARGVSLASCFLELSAITAMTTYCYMHSYPFSSYGDGAFLGLQTAVVAYLVLYYNVAQDRAILFALIYPLLCVLLTSGLVPMGVLALMQSLVIPVTVAGKSVQAYSNFQAGSTGQLSAITVFMMFLGSLARIFTSVQETGDPIMILTYASTSVFNGVLAGQVVFYWNAGPARPKKTKKED
ncbi:unnamed protein product [Cyprideis torosa]|uniref:Mannose-P-dolichol utilization defect 1 protein homolog n=1 Tax=Cyprideis torosa TaxID=163714 RepID=A0A7R8WG48_9CRUS|nr:unnamed protein product [Cyprideis torosa]CAG0892535.1 unnamed protein product [Cyprideis torosa]